jgi:hypothetical protein
VREILNMKLSKAEKLATQYADPERLHAIRRRWYGEAADIGRQKFVEAMAGLKFFSEDGAQPTRYHGEAVTLTTAKELVLSSARYPKAMAPLLREIAVHYVDMLGQIRENNNESCFLYKNDLE